MADLDTAAKRRAAIQFLPWRVTPDADGAIDDHDRAQSAGLYSGIAIGAPVVVFTPTGAMVISFLVTETFVVSFVVTSDFVVTNMEIV